MKMTSKVQLDRDVISRIWKHNLDKDRLDLSDFKIGVRFILFLNYLKGEYTCISKIEIFRDFIKTMHKNDFFIMNCVKNHEKNI